MTLRTKNKKHSDVSQPFSHHMNGREGRTKQAATSANKPKRPSTSSKLQIFQSVLSAELKKHVISQPKLVEAVIMATLTGINLCLIGDSGIAKSHAAETMMKILGLKSTILPLNPDVTPADVTGMMILDQETHKLVYRQSPFLNGNHAIVLDEINRSSDKTQDALLDILGNQRVIMDEMVYDLSDIFTTIMTMNPPEHGGTRDIISALADRMDYVLYVQEPDFAGKHQILNYMCEPPPINSQEVADETATMLDRSHDLDRLGGHELLKQLIRESREQFRKTLKFTPDEVKNEVIRVSESFRKSTTWKSEPTARTRHSMVKMTTIHALLRGRMPTKEDVWQVAAGCLNMMLQAADWSNDWTNSTETRVKRINSQVDHIRRTPA